MKESKNKCKLGFVVFVLILNLCLWFSSNFVEFWTATSQFCGWNFDLQEKAKFLDVDTVTTYGLFLEFISVHNKIYLTTSEF